jgi:phosphoribosyl 1,2-cyclic phosphate phosphodiesterase
VEQITGVKALIIDALRHKPHPTHMNIEEALLLSARVRPGETWFTHICHDLGHEETQKNLPHGVKLAYDGLKITV